MKKINLRTLSRLLSSKTGREISFTKIEKIAVGSYSDGFRLITSDEQSFFLKHIRVNDLGFESIERKAMSLIMSDGMARRAQSSPASIGVVVLNEEEGVIFPNITNSTEVYHLQEFAGGGTSYSMLLEQNINKTSVDDEDTAKLSVIADALIKIHTVKHHSKDKKQLTAIYNDGLRNILTNPELSISTLSEFPLNYNILNIDGQKEFISLMYENIREWMGRSDRLSALHGDFWGANIFFREDGSIFIIDYSRIPWGDPATDVGWFISQYLWYYHLTGNSYFKELTETWLSIYESKSGDKEIRKAIPLVVGWTGIVQVNPRFLPNLDVTVASNFLHHIKEILKHKEFMWID